MRMSGKLGLALLAISAVIILLAIYLALIFTPTHSTMGDVQRIFYFHVASAWVSYVAFGVTFIGGLGYLKTKKYGWDSLALSSAEIGIVFCTLAITTGPLWGKAVWGVYWRWEDMKLFITLVLWLIFIAYLALRTNVKSKPQRANLSGVFGILGFICIPLSFAANRIWTQYHPTIIATSQGTLQSSMGMSLGVAVIGFTFLYLFLLLARLELEDMRQKVEDIKISMGDVHE